MRSDMLKSAKTVLLAGITALLVTLPAFAKTTIPSKPYLYVKDEADVLSTDEEDDLNRMLSEYDKETGNQIAVLLVDTTGSESIEKYSYQVATKWGIGQADKDNGILITIATDDHKDRIEVGKGLEECVTDARSGHILRSDEVKTAFQKEKWYEGTKSIITQVQNCIQTDGKEIDQAIEKEKETTTAWERRQLAVVFSFASISCWIAMIVASYLVFGLIGLSAAILIGIFAPFPATCVFCLISIVTFTVTLVSSISKGSFGGGSSSGGDSSSDDWSSGGGGWSSGGSSFGGGSFGGGGASGSW